jgi:O-antigen ligase
MNLVQSIKESCFYRLCAAIAAWCSAQWEKSWIIDRFSSQKSGLAQAEGSIFHKIFLAIHHGLAWLFGKLHLTKLLQGSAFCIPALWCGLAVALTPVLPTMASLALVLVSFASLVLVFGRERERKLVHFPANKFIYIFVFIFLYATVTSVTPKGSLFVGLITAAFTLFAIAVMNAFTKWSHVRALCALMVLAGVAVSLYGFWQYLHPQNYTSVWTDTDLFTTFSFRVYATFANPNVLGEYFLLILPLAAALVLTSRTWGGRIFWLGCGGVMMLCLLLTYSRGCYLGILFAVALFLVLLDRRFILLGIVGLALLPVVMPASIMERFLSIGDLTDTSSSYRLLIYLGTLGMLKDYWFSGIGPGMEAFNQVYPAYAYHAVSAPHSHNLFLQLTSDTGIFGMGVFCLVIFSFYRTCFTALRGERDFETRVFIITGISAVSGFMVQSMTDYTFYNYRVMLLFWAVLALGLLFTRCKELKGANNG